MEHLRQAFRDEADELLADLELSLLELERNPGDAELVDRIFRAMHTIKGSSAMFGFDAIASFSHEVETLLELLRAGRVRVTKELVGVTLQARDRIRAMLDDPAGDGDAARTADIAAELRALAGAAATGAEAPPAPSEASATPLTCLIRFRPDRDIFKRGLRPLQLLNELRDLGPCRVTVHTDDIPLLADLDPELCYLSWDVELTTTQGLDAVHDVFMFVGEESGVEIETVAAGAPSTPPLPPASPGEVLAESRRHDASGEPGEETGARGAKAISSIRVTADKLDRLINLVGELVTVQARLSQTTMARNDAELIGLAEEVERLTAGLRDSALTIRMVPIGSTFSRFKRMVHDLSRELGKDVALVTAGAETELDKTVIEKLNDPLVHLIRNSIDHGIEPPDVRLAAGKPARGTIQLAAVHSGDSVLVTIRDDGAGIDREAVRARGAARGLIPAGGELSDAEILNLLFVPGFSTAETITSISGRGVGMDVVKKGVDSLRGAVSITSTPGEGTAVTVRIPLTLAIIESLLVRIGADSFVIPLSLVEECIELTAADVARAHGRHLADVRGGIVPYIPLRERFGIAGDRQEIEQIVIVELEGKRVGLVVDHVVGEHQTVIKSIGRMFRDVRGVSGATILGDGSVALILDVPQLVAEEERGEQPEKPFPTPALIAKETHACMTEP